MKLETCDIVSNNTSSLGRAGLAQDRKKPESNVGAVAGVRRCPVAVPKHQGPLDPSMEVH